MMEEGLFTFMTAVNVTDAGEIRAREKRWDRPKHHLYFPFVEK